MVNGPAADSSSTEIDTHDLPKQPFPWTPMLGPYVVRIVPDRPFRYVVAIAVFGLAAALVLR